MKHESNRSQSASGTFMGGLLRDVRANTMAIMAASLIPLCGIMGGGLDAARLYITKTRLQHACDAGTLAGRKAMAGGTWNQSGGLPNTTALKFFDANFADGTYGSGGLSRSFSENAGKVTGTASATVPMTLMRVLGRASETITVVCDAEQRLPNTDVMFVLDNTGSMSTADAGGGQTRIDALKVAVKCFYEIVAKLDTDAECTTGVPSGGTGTQVQIRFGFVPYSTNVNVGKLLPTEYFADSWPYQSRERATIYGVFSSFGSNTRNAGTYSGYTTQNFGIVLNSAACNDTTYPIPADTWTLNGTPSFADAGTETATGWQSYAPYIQRNYRRTYNNTLKTCTIEWRQRTNERRTLWTRAAQTDAGAVASPAWTYKQTTLNVSGLKAGSGVNWNNSVNLPIGNNFTTLSAVWDGCIEERQTVWQTTPYTPIPTGALDLNIDLVPSASVAGSQWGPALSSVVWARKDGLNNTGNYTQAAVTNTTQSYTGAVYDCARAARKLQQWPDAVAFDTYVDSMTTGGNTYHDTGVLWGARLMSPNGIFASENALTPQGGEIERHLILMTDGDPCTSALNYQAYGIAWYDRRTTDPSVVPTEGCTTTGTLTQQVNARTDALCTAVKNKNITLWVVTFGTVAANTVTRMTNCASPGRYYNANNAAQLQSTFAQIASQISQLRLTS